MRKLINRMFHRDDGDLTAWVDTLISSIDASVSVPEPDYEPGPNNNRPQPKQMLSDLKELRKMVAELGQTYTRLERASKPIELIEMVEQLAQPKHWESALK